MIQSIIIRDSELIPKVVEEQQRRKLKRASDTVVRLVNERLQQLGYEPEIRTPPRSGRRRRAA